MEYTRISNLENKYPNNENYIAAPGNMQLVSLFGLYSDKNKLDFNLPSLKDINYVRGTNFRFILAIFKDYTDTKPVYYTSEKYFQDLTEATNEGNPYFLQASFANTNIVSYVYEDVIKMVDSMKPLEQKSRVDFRINIFAGVSGSVDYDNLVTYIDWLVDKQSPLDDINFGVLEPTTISGWNVLDGNFSTGEIKTTISASYGIGSQFVSILDSTTLDYESDLKFEREKLEKIQKQIDAFNLEIKTKSNYKLPDLVNAYTTVDGSKYVARTDVNIVRRIRGNSNDVRERQKYVTDRLIEEINLLNTQKISAEKAVGEVQNKVNAAKKAAGDAVNKAKEELDKLKSLGADLMNKIPKIPKLPAIPKIPKLPTLAALGAMALALVPPLPALPKLPSLPKKPSFKLPPLKLFKPKKPKEPKKIKKNKGKGLKGALGDLQNAVNSAQGAVAGAAAAAAGAAAAAVAAADKAKSAAANAQAAVDNAKSAVQSGIDSAKSTVQGAVDNVKSTAQSTVDNVKNNIPKV
jgi:uncharacterized protein YjbJ (UPF0337 family)